MPLGAVRNFNEILGIPCEMEEENIDENATMESSGFQKMFVEYLHKLA